MKPKVRLKTICTLVTAATAAGLLTACADPLLGPTSRAQGRQCNQLVVPEQREACLRDISGPRPVTVPRDLNRPPPAPSDEPAVRKDAAAARAASRPAPAASAP